MLYFIVSWGFLGIASLLIGITCLNVFRSSVEGDEIESTFIAAYVGIAALCLIFTTLALVAPLSPGVSFMTYACILGISLALRTTRTRALALLSRFSSYEIAGCIILTLAVAFAINYRVDWYDTGLYHLGSIRWLSEFGAVPGLASINTHFGKTSSWFTLSASLLPDILGNRIGAVTNGFIFLLAILHLGIIANRLPRRSPSPNNYFIAIFLALMILNWTVLQPLLTSKGFSILNSFSPDVPINIMIGVVAWMILICDSESSSRSGNYLSSQNLNLYFAPLILAAIAVSIKITALPLLIGSFLFYISKNFFQIRKIGLVFLLVTALLVPSIVLSLITSGCPLFPSEFMCVDVPWLIDQSQQSDELARVTQSVDLGGELIQKWVDLIPESPKLLVAFSLFLLALFVGIKYFIDSFRFGISSKFWMATFSFLGIFFLLIVSHDNILRFGLGYFLIVPCWLTANFLVPPSRPRTINILSLPRLLVLSVLMDKATYGVVAFALITFINISSGPKYARSRISLLPPPLPQPDFIKYQVGGTTFLHPERNLEEEFANNRLKQCWYSALPCTPRLRQDVILRDPEEGLSSGFVPRSRVN